MLACSFLIKSSGKLLVIRTGLKARLSSIFGQIRQLILELLALEWRKFHTFELEYLWSQLANLDQILCVASLGWGKGCIRFWGRLTLAHWTQVSDGCPLGFLLLKLSRLMTKPTKWSVRLVKTQISLGIHPVWSEFTVRMKKPWFFSFPLSGQWRLIRLGGCPGWSESSLGAHVICWFCYAAALFTVVLVHLGLEITWFVKAQYYIQQGWRLDLKWALLKDTFSFVMCSNLSVIQFG